MNSAHATSPGERLDWLDQAVGLACENVHDGGGPFGAVIVRGETLVSTGINRVTLDNDPSAHAEVVAIRKACAHLGTFSLTGCTLYSSCEPCPMCAASAFWARIDKIFYAADRHDAATGGFDDLRFYEAFTTDASTWPSPTVRLATPTAFNPFQKWLAKEDKTAY